MRELQFAHVQWRRGRLLRDGERMRPVVSGCKERVSCLEVSLASEYGLEYVCYVPRRNMGSLSRTRVLACSRVLHVYEYTTSLKVHGVGLANNRPLIHGNYTDLTGRVGTVPKVRGIALAAGKVLLTRRLSTLLSTKVSTVGVDLSALSPRLFGGMTEHSKLRGMFRKVRTTLTRPKLSLGVGDIPIVGRGRGFVKVTKLTRGCPVRIHFVRVVPVKFKGRFPFRSRRSVGTMLRRTCNPVRTIGRHCKGNPYRCCRVTKFGKGVKFVDTVARGFYGRYGHMHLASRKFVGKYLRCRRNASLEKLVHSNYASSRLGRTVCRIV